MRRTAPRHTEILRRLAADEPRTTPALGALLALRHPALESRVLVAGPDDRSMCPVVRQETGVWVGYPILANPADARELGRTIDRSPATSLWGDELDVEPLLPFVGRVDRIGRTRRFTAPAVPTDWPPPADVTRVATALDLEALDDLYDGFELPFGRTERGLHRSLRDAVRRQGVVVIDGPAGLDGALIAVSMAPRYVEWSQLTVRPRARGQGASWALVARAAALNRATGRGFVASIASSNPMTIPEHLGTIGVLLSVRLHYPNRVRGERRLRNLWLTVSPTRHRRPARTGDPLPEI
jgi:hypothetical protein